ncbi:uncharacterized protein (DUF849 family) [Bradyrhizobium elkanii]|uniref:Uncharacterized protein (DUF849 family) n=1 Tax=Bradyrhizobium elkanii TaxID=29448 RepID=A0ABV4F5F6_BRAEL
MKMRKVIVTCAVTGSVHTPSMSPHLPITPDQIAASAVEAAAAGASVVHLHARDPESGRPTQDPDVYRQFLPQIVQACDVVVNITTGGSPILPLEERLRPAVLFEPELASLNMGSMNFGMYEMLGRFTEFRHEWERPYLENSADIVFRNTFRDIQHILQACSASGTRFEIECYDVGHLYTAAHFRDRGLLEGPIRLRYARRHRRALRRYRYDEAHRRSLVRRRLYLVCARYRPCADSDRNDVSGHGRECSGRARGFALGRPWETRREQCHTGATHAHDTRSPLT